MQRSNIHSIVNYMNCYSRLIYFPPGQKGQIGVMAAAPGKQNFFITLGDFN